jgi:hypothetical protein
LTIKPATTSLPTLLVLEFEMNTTTGQTHVDKYVDLTANMSAQFNSSVYDVTAVIYNVSVGHVTAELLVDGKFIYYDDLDGARLLNRNISKDDNRPSFHATRAESPPAGGKVERFFVGDRIAQIILSRRPSL